MSRANIDGDVLKYACGFASDAAAKSNGMVNEPLANCLHGVNVMIDSIRRAADCEDYTIYLSHPINRRMEVFPEYKANRDPTHRPHWFKEIHEFLRDRHGAVFSEEGDEADDALGIAQREDTVLCSIDKDLDMIPGNHYNWGKKRKENGVYYVGVREADNFFYEQLITGDSTDNIPGIYKHSGIRAMPKLKEPLHKMHTNKEKYDYVVNEIYKGDRAFVDMIGQLLWIKRDNNLWVPP